MKNSVWNEDESDPSEVYNKIGVTKTFYISIFLKDYLGIRLIYMFKIKQNSIQKMRDESDPSEIFLLPPKIFPEGITLASQCNKHVLLAKANIHA